MSNFDGVKQFHKTFGLNYNEVPAIQPPYILTLRKNLITEEYRELMDALEIGDLHEIAKEATDLLYVVYGLGVDYGIDLDACFAEVQRSNMSKLTKDGMVLRRADGKVLKSSEYSPADLRPILGI